MTQQSSRKIGIATALIVSMVAVLLFSYIYIDYLGIEATEDNVTALAVTVYFEDGTSKLFESTTDYDGTLSMPSSMSVYVNGQKIKGIHVACKVTLNNAPTITSWTSAVTQKMELYESGESEPATASTGTFPNSGTSWTSGTTRTVATLDLSVSQIEGAIASCGGDGTYAMQIVDTVSLTVTDSDGEETTLTGSAVAYITLTYTNNSAMSIIVTTETSSLN
ncbi:MAG: hypothetical protein ACOWW1_09730 [archaeon]